MTGEWWEMCVNFPFVIWQKIGFGLKFNFIHFNLLIRFDWMEFRIMYRSNVFGFLFCSTKFSPKSVCIYFFYRSKQVIHIEPDLDFQIIFAFEKYTKPNSMRLNVSAKFFFQFISKRIQLKISSFFLKKSAIHCEHTDWNPLSNES